jgi:crossover junction endodeoxyribonuclease RusA
MIKLILPWPPSVNHYWRFGNGRFYISGDGKRFKTIVAGTMIQGGVKPFSGSVAVTIDAHPPDRRARDLDNLNKCLLDSLVTRHGLAGLYHNDAQIKRLESTMHDFDATNAGNVVVTVRPWPDAVGALVPATRPVPMLRTHSRPEPEPALLNRCLQRIALWLKPSTASATT